jgi:hypothetical protein
LTACGVDSRIIPGAGTRLLAVLPYF